MASSNRGSVFSNSLAKLCWHGKPAEKSNLRIVYNNVALQTEPDRAAPPQLSYKTNKIKTTKYTILTFLPKNLFEQFHRIANMYFLFVALLNFVPQVGAFGKEIALIPVVCVLAVTGIKDGFEDYRRYKQDKKVNHSKCLVYKKKTKSYEDQEFSRVLVGDIVKVKCNEVIPADLLLLACSENSSTCFIETANLDGESNLKQRNAVDVALDERGRMDPETPIMVACELPNAELNKFNGYVIKQTDNGHKKGLSKENLLLRGCVLRNTDYIKGIVIYAGHDTKAMKNSSGPRYKRSKLERYMNRDVIWCLVILLFLCFFSAIGNGVWLSLKWKEPEDIPYIPYTEEGADDGIPALDGTTRPPGEVKPGLEAFTRFWTFIIIYQVMIPLSLYATLEIVKSCQIYFIHHDKEMYYEESNIKPICRALNITEELGQVQHIFSDKTGTLTENKMVFKACSIGNLLFSESVPSPSAVGDIREEEESQLVSDPLFATAHSTSVLTTVANNDTDDQVDLTDGQKSNINEFLLLLATCNTVVVSSHSHNLSMSMLDSTTTPSNESIDTIDTTITSSNGAARSTYSRFGIQEQNGSATGSVLEVPMTTFTPVKNALKKITERLRRSFVSEDSNGDSHSLPAGEESMLSQKTLTSRYEAESPDELALVKAVCKYGCRLLSRTNQSVSVYLPSQGDGPIEYQVLAVLPFDSVRKCMSVVMKDESRDEIVLYTKGADNIIFDKIITTDYEQRELVKQTRIYVNHFAKDGLRTLCMAKKVLKQDVFEAWLERYTNCDIEDREDHQFKLCNELETDLELMGATGIEDRLQDGVAESMRALEMANIKVWVLTGDKQETAINIGYSCGLLPQDAAILTLNVPNADEVESVLQGHLRGTLSRPRTLSDTSAQSQASSITKCLVIDGKTLSHIFSGNLSKSFLRLADNCLSVLCCRTTPSQKAQIVDLVKTKCNKLTLSIGDGANDVNMIRTANVGIGIEGLEGKQASMAADFSIGRFKHLVRLLFVHGHWTYDRLAVMTLYNFFKNSNLIFVLFWYQIYCMFSGQNHIDQIYLIVFHLLFTSLPPIVFAILDQDLPDHVLMSHPTLYQQGPEDKLYHKYSYWLQIFDSLYQSLAVFFATYMHYAGADIGIWSFGTVQTITLVLSQLCILAFETRHWQWPFISSILISLAGFWAFVSVLNAACLTCDHPSDPYWVMQHVLSTADSWLCIVLGVTVAVVPRFVFLVISNMLYPTDVSHYRSLLLSNSAYKESQRVNIVFPDESNSQSNRRTVQQL